MNMNIGSWKGRMKSPPDYKRYTCTFRVPTQVGLPSGIPSFLVWTFPTHFFSGNFSWKHLSMLSSRSMSAKYVSISCILSPDTLNLTKLHDRLIFNLWLFPYILPRSHSSEYLPSSMQRHIKLPYLIQLPEVLDIVPSGPQIPTARWQSGIVLQPTGLPQFALGRKIWISIAIFFPAISSSSHQSPASGSLFSQRMEWNEISVIILANSHDSEKYCRRPVNWILNISLPEMMVSFSCWAFLKLSRVRMAALKRSLLNLLQTIWKCWNTFLLLSFSPVRVWDVSTLDSPFAIALKSLRLNTINSLV